MGILLGILLFIVGFISLFSVLSFAKPRKRPTDRLESWMSAYEEPEIQEDKPERKGFISLIGSQAERLGVGKRVMEKTRIELVRADIPLTGYEFNITRGLIGVMAGTVCFVVFKSWAMGIVIPLVIWFLADAYIASLKAKRLKLFSSQLGDALTLFSNSLRAGFSFLQAVSSVAREMPDPVAKEFTILLKEMSLGLSVDKALSNLLIRVPLDDLELLIIAILIQKEVGGNLAEIIDTIASTIRERITIQLEIKALTAQGKLSGIVVGLLPLLLGIVMFAFNPSYVTILFVNPIGQILIAIGIMNMIIGILLINKIVKIEV